MDEMEEDFPDLVDIEEIDEEEDNQEELLRDKDN